MGCLEKKCQHADFESVTNYCQTQEIKLTPLRKTVLHAMCVADKPLTAYALLDALRKENVSLQAMSVYRILNFLLEKKLIHRIESLNAFVLCHHLAQSQHISQWLICDQCGDVTEFDSPQFHALLEQVDQITGFKVNTPVIELSGLCERCR